MLSRADRILARLLKLCSAEKAALVAGRFEQLATFEATKSRLLAQLAEVRTNANPKMLDRLRQNAMDNARLYEASMAGIREVQRNVASLINGGAELRTYGADGGRNAMLRTNSNVQRRA